MLSQKMVYINYMHY